MEKLLIIVVMLVVVGIGYWLISPFFIDKKVSESLPTNIESEIIKTGEFAGFDKIHTGSGTVSVIKSAEDYVIRFEEDFNVANGPDLYVGLGKDGEYKKGSEIAKLKGNIGSQNYIIPDDVSLADYNEVWIWCRAFSIGFAKAVLK